MIASRMLATSFLVTLIGCGDHQLHNIERAVCYVRERSTVLLVKENAAAGFDFPGGGIAPEEHPETAVVREVFEETGLTVRVVAVVATALHPRPTVVYQCEVVGGQLIAANGDVEGVAFYPVRTVSPEDVSHRYLVAVLGL